MANQYTRGLVENRFRTLCDALGMRRDVAYSESKGSWKLDYARCYGGYVIAQIGDNGSQSHPFGNERRSGKEMCEVINFALRAIQLDRLNGAKSAQYWPDDKSSNSEVISAAELQEQAEALDWEAK